MMRKNGITMAGNIDRCFLLVYRVPAAQLEPLLPKPLELITRGGYGFVNVLVSELSHMRPKGLPAWLGVRYRQAGFRLHCRYGTTEGLYFARSDADSRLMVLVGNLLTEFRFHFAEIGISEQAVSIGDESNAKLDLTPPPALAPGSPFESLDEANRELKYKPAAFFVHPDRVDVLRVGRDEQDWKSKLVRVGPARFEFLKPYDATLEVCYRVEPIRYVWNRAERIPI